MEAHQLIREWLDTGQAYAQGLELARTHGIGGAQLKLLESGENKFTQGKLRTALMGVLDTLQAQVATGQAVASTVASCPQPGHNLARPAPAAAPVIPPELVQLRARRTATFKQAQHHHGLLRTTPEGRESFEHAKRIKQLFRENAELFAQERYYEKFGFLPVTAPVATIDRSNVAQVTTRRNTLRTYISNNGKGKRGTPEKLAAWSAELLQLELILGHGQPV